MFAVSRGAALLLLSTIACAAAGPAYGQSQQLQVVAKGTINPSCSVSIGTPFPVAVLSESGSVSAAPAINCNKAFTVTARSTKGAMTSHTLESTGFTNKLLYSIAFSLPLDDNSGTLEITCTSSELAVGAGCSADSGGKTAINKTALLQASWTTPTSPRLVKGSYRDTLTISVAALP